MASEGGGSKSRSNSYYNVLGIRKDASISDVRTAYRKLAMVPATAVTFFFSGEFSSEHFDLRTFHSDIADVDKFFYKNLIFFGQFDIFVEEMASGSIREKPWRRRRS